MSFDDILIRGDRPTSVPERFEPIARKELSLAKKQFERIQRQTARILRDAAEGGADQLPAVAVDGTEDIAEDAVGMHAHQHAFGLRDLAPDLSRRATALFDGRAFLRRIEDKILAALGRPVVANARCDVLVIESRDRVPRFNGRAVLAVLRCLLLQICHVRLLFLRRSEEKKARQAGTGRLRSDGPGPNREAWVVLRTWAAQIRWFSYAYAVAAARDGTPILVKVLLA